MPDEAVPPVNIAEEYRTRVGAMTPLERVRRAESLFVWSRALLARSVVAAQGSLPDDQIKWEVALRQYGMDRRSRRLIDELRTSASR